jgi:predicted membrane protein
MPCETGFFLFLKPMKKKRKNCLRVLKVAKEVTQKQGEKTVKHKNILLEDQQNELIDERKIYNTFLKYQDIKVGLEIRGDIIHMEGMTIVKFAHETLSTAIENQKYKFENDLVFERIVLAAKKSEGVN